MYLGSSNERSPAQITLMYQSPDNLHSPVPFAPDKPTNSFLFDYRGIIQVISTMHRATGKKNSIRLSSDNLPS